VSTKDPSQWGRVDESGAVYVRIGDDERLVGEYPDATPEEALAYFVRKYHDLEGQVSLLEQRARGGAPASDLAKAVAHLAETVEHANAVGDLASLSARLEAIRAKVGELTAEQSEAAKAALEHAVAERTSIVEAAEAIARRDLSNVQWRQVTAEMDELFARWQRHQADGPRVPRAVADELWKRFRDARHTVESARKAYFAQLDSTHKEARAAKQALIARAEALASKGPDGIPAYRSLLDEWKRAGRAGKKVDDQLWERFKAAGDALYAAKSAIVAKENEEYSANLEAKLALLDEAETILRVTDRRQARELLQSVQARWERIGKVPRDSVRTVEDRLRKVEAHVRALDEEHWERSNPARRERSEGFAGQLQDAIAKLEAELAEAEASGDTRRIEEARTALETRKAWLDAVKGS